MTNAEVEKMISNLTDKGLPLSVANMLRIGDLDDRLEACETALQALGMEMLSKIMIVLMADLVAVLRNTPDLDKHIAALGPSTYNIVKLYLIATRSGESQ